MQHFIIDITKTLLSSKIWPIRFSNTVLVLSSNNLNRDYRDAFKSGNVAETTETLNHATQTYQNIFKNLKT